ncbi:hypothetical protein MY04_4351 [Flammeovirga sp. MY04]|uniref:hypothetical protein n=1 Tax=Flammeovirga sp. MY04 TaxID=1191459 RepID=UPI0008063594|nr:hypothetical protein [Flammeovirga sp. MY04]ANQ51689.1 hypothetical protein MY04_4351 [Flammeovirga sp. MY04]
MLRNIFNILFVILFVSCQSHSVETGIEIYQVKKQLPDFTKDENPNCRFCLDLEVSDLFDKPLLTEKDIKEFNYTNQQIILTEKAKQKLEDLEIPLVGLPMAMVLDGEIIYGFWFWDKYSSFGCDRVYTYPNINFKIKFGLPPTNAFGEDPRFDERLEDYLEN